VRALPTASLAQHTHTHTLSLSFFLSLPPSNTHSLSFTHTPIHFCAALRFQGMVLPLLLHHNLPDLFIYNSCSFKVQKSKGGTGRVVGFRELGLCNRWGESAR
jgi:hypothetical protein